MYLYQDLICDVIANRPAATSKGRLFFSTDEKKIYYDLGTSWLDVSPAGVVLSVAGRTGAVVLSSSDISGLAASATTDTTNAANISSGLLPVARGGTGTATPSLVAGTNITISGTWPNQTVTAASGGSSVLSTKGDLLGFDTAINRIPVGANGTVLTADSTAALGVSYKSQPYDIPCSLVGKPGAGAIVLILTAARTISFTGNFSGAYGSVGTNPTATAAYSVLKNGSSIGTVSISTSGVFTFTTTSGAAQSLAAGDRLTITAPSSQDATLSDVGFTIPGTR